MSKNPSL